MHDFCRETKKEKEKRERRSDGVILKGHFPRIPNKKWGGWSRKKRTFKKGGKKVEWDEKARETEGHSTNLVFINVVCQLGLSKFIESDDNQSHENVYKEKWEDNKEHDVENGHFNAKPRFWTLFFISRRHGIL